MCPTRYGPYNGPTSLPSLSSADTRIKTVRGSSMGPLRRSGFPAASLSLSLSRGPTRRDPARHRVPRAPPPLLDPLSHCNRGSADRGSRPCGRRTVAVYTVAVRYTRPARFPVIQSRPRRESRVRAPDKIVIDGTRDRYFAPSLFTSARLFVHRENWAFLGAILRNLSAEPTYPGLERQREIEHAAGVVRAIIKL